MIVADPQQRASGHHVLINTVATTATDAAEARITKSIAVSGDHKVGHGTGRRDEHPGVEDDHADPHLGWAHTVECDLQCAQHVGAHKGINRHHKVGDQGKAGHLEADIRRQSNSQRKEYLGVKIGRVVDEEAVPRPFNSPRARQRTIQ